MKLLVSNWTLYFYKQLISQAVSYGRKSGDTSQSLVTYDWTGFIHPRSRVSFMLGISLTMGVLRINLRMGKLYWEVTESVINWKYLYLYFTIFEEVYKNTR